MHGMKSFVIGSALTVAVLYEALWSSPATTQTAPTCSAVRIRCPVAGGCTVTSPFQPARENPVDGVVRPHTGVDYRAAEGTSIQAAAGGVVERSYLSTTYGNTVIIRHSDGGATLYAHLLDRSVSDGDTVTAGQALGSADSTGRSQASHLHFEYVGSGAIIQSPGRIDPDGCVDNLNDYIGSYNVRYVERVLTGNQFCQPENFDAVLSISKNANGQYSASLSPFSIPLTASANSTGFVGSGTASYPDDEGTSTTTVNLTISSPESLTGTATWRYSAPNGAACSGDGTISGAKI